MFSNQINREVVLSYSTDAITTSIQNVCKSSGSKFQIKNHNKLMNNFTLSLVGGMAVIVNISIVLTEIETNKTKMVLETTRATNNANQANTIIDGFLNKISDSLEGKVEDVKSKNKGCFGVVALIAFFVIISIIAFAKLA